jgi:hypothetical protein
MRKHNAMLTPLVHQSGGRAGRRHRRLRQQPDLRQQPGRFVQCAVYPQYNHRNRPQGRPDCGGQRDQHHRGRITDLDAANDAAYSLAA